MNGHTSTYLKSKIHRATVTDTQLYYDGSIAIDPDLVESANMNEYEQVEVYNETNGNRWTTYIIFTGKGSGEISVRGPGARLAEAGDVVVICTYLQTRFKCPKPTQVSVNENNEVVRIY